MATSAGNPFYVDINKGRDIGGSFMQGMQMKDNRDARVAREAEGARKAEGQAAMSAARTDAEKLAVMRDYPELAGAVKDQVTFTNDQSKQRHLDTYKAMRDAKTPEDALRLQQEHIKYLESMGIDSTESRKDLERLAAGDMTPQQIRELATLELQAHEEGMQYLTDEKALNAEEAPGSTLGKLVRDREMIVNKWGEKDPRVAAFDRAIAEESGLTTGEVNQIDPALLVGLSPQEAAAASAAYRAAGGGKDGMKAYEDALKSSKARTDINALPDNIRTTFPQATNAELSELEAVAAAAGDAKAGMAAAQATRDKQRTKKKGIEAQDSALRLTEEILSDTYTDQLEDVLGAIEGDDDSWIGGVGRAFNTSGDQEYDLINKIDQLGAILTAENLDMLSGTMSDTDIALLRSIAGGGLNRKQSEKEFRKQVGLIQEALKRAQATRPRRFQ